MNLLREKKEIIDWLNLYGVANYSLVEDVNYGYVVNIDGDVKISGKRLECFKVKFNNVTGDFDCSRNELTSLYGSPESVRSFYCYFNRLEDLKFAPTNVSRTFHCVENNLKSLFGCPKKVDSLYCGDNQLTSLEFCPEEIFCCLHAENNKINTLKYLPVSMKLNMVDISRNIDLGLLQEIRYFKQLKKHQELELLRDTLNNRLTSNTKK